MKKTLCLLLVLLMAAACTGCCAPIVSEPSQESTVTVNGQSAESFLRNNFPRIDGSTSTIPLDAAVRSAIFSLPISTATAQVTHTTTFGSFGRLLNGECDITFTVPISDEQQQQAQQKGITLQQTPIAREAFVFVLNSKNPVSQLTQQQLKDIYSGKITNWKDVGGNDAEIVAYQRNKTSGSQTYMTRFMGDTPLMQPNTTFVPAAMAGLLDAVANYDNAENAIGYSVYAYAAEMYGTGTELKFVAVDGIYPDSETMTDGSYPLLSENYAVFDSAAAVDSPARVLAQWLVSDAGQRAVAAGGYIPLRNVAQIVTQHSDAYKAVGTGSAKPDGYSAPDYCYLRSLSVTMTPDDPDVAYSDASFYPGYYSGGVTFSLDGLNDSAVAGAIDNWLNASASRLMAQLPELQSFIQARRESYTAVYPDKYWAQFGLEPQLYGEVGQFTYYPLSVELSAYNGYLCASVVLRYKDPAGNPEGYNAFPLIYDAEAAVFDLYTGKQLSTSDMFWKGEDFVPQLNALVAQSAVSPVWESDCYYPLTHENPVITSDGVEFCGTKIYMTHTNHCFMLGAEFSIQAQTLTSCVMSLPRDMADVFTDKTETVRRIVVQGSSQDGALRNGSAASPDSPFVEVEPSVYVTAEAAAKINAAMKEYTDELYSKTLQQHFEQAGMTLKDFYASGAGGIYFEEGETVEQAMERFNINEQEVFERGIIKEIIEFEVYGGRFVSYGKAGPLFWGTYETMFPDRLTEPVSLIFDAKTGERYDAGNLFKDGWEQVSVWHNAYAVMYYDEESNDWRKSDRESVDAPDYKQLVLCSILAGWSESDPQLIFITPDGKTVYEATLPREYFRWD